MHYEVTRRDGRYEIHRDGDALDIEFEPGQVLRRLYRDVQAEALSAWPGASVLRAVSGSCCGEHFLLVGEHGADRSDVAVRLLSLGVAIEGDDLVLVSGGVAHAYPRPLRVRDPAWFPPHTPPIETVPFLTSSGGRGIWALDLARAGFEWRITPRAPDLLIELETNYGGQSRVSELAARDTTRVLMESSHRMGSPVQAIRDLAFLANGARGLRLRLGAMDDVETSWPGRLP